MFGFSLLLIWQRNRLALGVGVMTAAALLPFVHLAHERAEPLFSWRPFARLIQEATPTKSRVFFRAEDEYQLCGGLNYYLRQRIDLLAPPGWVPPTFLVGRIDRLFTPRAEFVQNWYAGTAVLVSDAVITLDDEAQLVPSPYVVVARAGERVLLRPASSSQRHPGTVLETSVTVGKHTDSEDSLRKRTTSVLHRVRKEDEEDH
jgi:hypothetical protein